MSDLRTVVFNVLEGFTLPPTVRKMLEAAYYATPAESEQSEPYGYVTVVKRPGCQDQHWFYRTPELPYLDNATEYHAVYTTPQRREPLTDEQINELQLAHVGVTKWFPSVVRAIEAAHGIGVKS